MKTWLGDTDLDRDVDSTDSYNFGNGYESQLTGWQNGDFNYDGVIDSADVTLYQEGQAAYNASL